MGAIPRDLSKSSKLPIYSAPPRAPELSVENTDAGSSVLISVSVCCADTVSLSSSDPGRLSVLLISDIADYSFHLALMPNLCLATSYIIMLDATEALSDVILPLIGSESTKSLFSLMSLPTPEPSEPTTRATAPLKST